MTDVNITVTPDFPPGAARLVSIFQENALKGFEASDVLTATINFTAMVICRLAKGGGADALQTMEYGEQNIALLRACIAENVDADATALNQAKGAVPLVSN